MNFLGSIGAGVISGIIVALLILGATEVVKKIVLPWYRSVTYRGVDLSGEWRSIGRDMELTLQLEQVAHQLSGILTTLVETNLETPSRTFSLKFEGFTQDGYVVGHFKSANRRQVLFWSTLLKLGPTGNELQGLMAIAPEGNRFDAEEIEWRRVD